MKKIWCIIINSCVGTAMLVGSNGNSYRAIASQFAVQPTGGEPKLEGIPLHCYLVEANSYTRVQKSIQLAAIAHEYIKAGQLDRAIALADNIEDISTYSRIVAAVVLDYVTRGQKAEAKQILDRSLQRAQTIGDSTIRSGALAEIARQYLRIGLLEDSWTLLNEIDSFSRSQAIAQIAIKYAKLGDFERGLTLVKSVQDASEKVKALSAIALLQKQRGIQQLTQALEVAETLGNHVVKAQALAEIARTYAELGQKQQAQIILARSQQALQPPVDSNVSVFTVKSANQYRVEALLAIAETSIKLGEVSQISEILFQAFEDAKKIEDGAISADLMAAIARQYGVAKLYDAAIEAIAKMSNDYLKARMLVALAPEYEFDLLLYRAKQLADTMEDDEQKAFILTKIAQNYANFVTPERALPFLCQVLTLTETLLNSASQTEVLIEVAQAYQAAGQNSLSADILDRAALAAQTIEGSKIQAYFFVKIAANHPEKASKFLDKALEIASIEDAFTTPFESYDRAMALADIAIEFAEIGQFERALEIANSIEFIDKITLLGEMAIKYAEVGQDKRAIAIANNIGDATKKTATLVAIASHYQRSRRNTEAVEVLDRALSVAKNLKTSQLEWLSAIASQYSAAGQFSQALAIVNEIQESDAKVKILVAIAASASQDGQKDRATEILSQAIQLANSIPDNSLQNLALAEIADGYVKTQEYERALQIANAIKPVEVTRIDGTSGQDSTLKDNILAEIAREYALADKEEAVLQIVKTLENNGTQFIILTELALQYVRDGKLDRALQLNQIIETDREKVKLFIEIARQYRELGQKDKAAESLNSAIAISETIQDESFQGSALQEIAVQYVEVGQGDRALAIAQMIRDRLFQSQALAEIAKYYAALGQSERAFEIVRTIKDSPAQISAIITQIVSQSKASERFLNQAVEIVKTQENNFDKVAALTAIAKAHAAAGQYPSAIATANIIEENPKRENLIKLLQCASR